MAKLKLRGKDLRSIGYPEGPVISIAMNVMERNYKFEKEETVMNVLKAILASPVEYADDGVGADIGCRMCLSIFDLDPKDLLQKEIGLRGNWGKLPSLAPAGNLTDTRTTR